MQLTRFTPMQATPMQVAPRFAALTLEVGKPLPYVIVGEKQRRQKQLKREMNSVAQIFQNWMTAHKAQIGKITDGLNIKLKLMTEETFNAAYHNKSQRARNRQVDLEDGTAQAAGIGGKFYLEEADGKQTRLQIRWPGNNPDGPMCYTQFNDWADRYILKPEALYNALTKALRMGVQNVGVANSHTFEDNH